MSFIEVELNALRAETAWLRETLKDRDKEIDELVRFQSDIVHKYQHLKEQFKFIVWDYLPTTPEFHSLRLISAKVETDVRVDEIVLAIKDPLGEGRFGQVFLGITDGPAGSKSEVAVKTVEKSGVRTFAALRNLANELACMQQLTIASERDDGLTNIVTLQGASRMSDSTLYICQSVGGSDLFQLMKHHARRDTTGISDLDSPQLRLPMAMVAVIVRGLMTGVAALHRHGWCHRDIKPENILVGANARTLVLTSSSAGADAAAELIHVRICDFGVCAKTSIPQLTQFCGSPGFFAPELCKGMGSSSTENDPDSFHADVVRGYDGAKADIFSAGATLLEMLLGHPRFNRLWAHAYAVRRSTMFEDLTCSLREATAHAVRKLESYATHAVVASASSSGALANNAQRRMTELNALALACIQLDPHERPISEEAAIAATRCFKGTARSPAPPVTNDVPCRGTNCSPRRLQCVSWPFSLDSASTREDRHSCSDDDTTVAATRPDISTGGPHSDQDGGALALPRFMNGRSTNKGTQIAQLLTPTRPQELLPSPARKSGDSHCRSGTSPSSVHEKSATLGPPTRPWAEGPTGPRQSEKCEVARAEQQICG